MSFIELVKSRRSLRDYSDFSVERAVIEECLEAARLAPSACNSQPWYFIVVDDPVLKDRLAAAAFSGVYSMNSFAGAAPVLVALVRQRSCVPARVGGFLKGTQFNLIDTGIAAEHFCLAAAERGLGTCMLGWFNGRAAKKILEVGRADKIELLISLGRPKNNWPDQRPRKPLNEFRGFNLNR